ncbi:hypothetical protein PV723_18370, partial [Streptomyces sp. AK04-3B]|nr:hypothetical protein [Streptomyces sp. AK04-3B]
MVRVRASLSQLPAHVPGREQPGAVEPAGGEPAAPHRLTVTGPDRVPGRSRTPGHDVPASLSDVVRLPLGGDGGGSG